MPSERTLCILKPDAVEKKKTGAILAILEERGFSLVALRRAHLTRVVAEGFYAVHKARPFYGSLCDYMSSGPVVIAVLAGDGAIARWRELMGATDPAKAAAGTIRKDLGQDVEKNAVHGSDAPETAAHEIVFYFSALEIVG